MSIRKDHLSFFEQQLSDFFRHAGRESLPWRKKNISAYEVWVSEIMLQQTQVARVIVFYERFLKRFPTVEDLASASWEEFLPFYQGLGYYVRGKNMLKTAQLIMSEYGGCFPRDVKLLEKLPGIGPYTAAAIMSFAYGDNHLAWDTNLFRVIGRFFFGGKNLVSERTFWEDAFITPKKQFNAALMDFGSALCTARPKCSACSLRSHCVYFKEEGKREKKEKSLSEKKIQRVDWGEASAYVFLHERHVQYYSSQKKQFRPFILEARDNTRSGIKKYFLEKHGLTVSVRPPHQKCILAGRPVILVNAQILLGTATFPLFSKKAVKEYNEGVFSQTNQ